MSSAQDSSRQPEKLRKAKSLGRMTESIAKELNESLCGVVVNASTCLRMLMADPPNVEGAREAARRSIRSSMRAAEAIAPLHDLLSEPNKRIGTAAPFRGGSSRVARGGTL